MKLSPMMETALHYARDNGGVLVRYPGGFWAVPNTPVINGVPDPYFGTTTIHALMTRGAVEVIERLPRGDPLRVQIRKDT